MLFSFTERYLVGHLTWLINRVCGKCACPGAGVRVCGCTRAPRVPRRTRALAHPRTPRDAHPEEPHGHRPKRYSPPPTPRSFAAIAGEEDRQRDGVELIPSENYTYPGGAGGARLRAHQQIRRGLSGPALLRRAGVHRRGRAPGTRARLRAVPRRARQRAAAVGLADEPGGVLRLLPARRHHPGDGPVARRPPDARRAGVAHGARLPLRPLPHPTPTSAGGIDFDAVRRLARETRPKIVLCGYTSYPRDYDYAAFKRRSPTRSARIAMADVSHVGGLIAGGVLRQSVRRRLRRRHHHHAQEPARPARRHDPVPQGARRGDRRLGLPRPAGRPAHERHRRRRRGAAEGAPSPRSAPTPMQVLRNAACPGRRRCSPRGCTLVTGGTDNHMLVLDTVASFAPRRPRRRGAPRRHRHHHQQADHPRRPRPPLRPSGIRLGTPAATTRGMGEAEMRQLAAGSSPRCARRWTRRRIERMRAAGAGDCVARFAVPALRVTDVRSADGECGRAEVRNTLLGLALTSAPQHPRTQFSSESIQIVRV